MQIEEAIKELRESYELKHRQWAYNCLDVIKEELEKKDKVIDEMANSLIGIGMYDIKAGLKVCFNEEEVKEYFYKKVE